MALAMLALCFICYGALRGMQEGYAVFLLPLEQDFGWSRGEVSSVYSVTFLVLGIAGPVIGILSDRWGPLRVAVAGVVIGAGAVALEVAAALPVPLLGAHQHLDNLRVRGHALRRRARELLDEADEAAHRRRAAA